MKRHRPMCVYLGMAGIDRVRSYNYRAVIDCGRASLPSNFQLPTSNFQLISHCAKMGGGMETNKNKFIEDWGAARETLERNFRWTRRNLAFVGLFGIAVPIFVYRGIVKEFHMQDEDNGKPYRKFLF